MRSPSEVFCVLMMGKETCAVVSATASALSITAATGLHGGYGIFAAWARKAFSWPWSVAIFDFMALTAAVSCVTRAAEELLLPGRPVAPPAAVPVTFGPVAAAAVPVRALAAVAERDAEVVADWALRAAASCASRPTRIFLSAVTWRAIPSAWEISAAFCWGEPEGFFGAGRVGAGFRAGALGGALGGAFAGPRDGGALAGAFTNGGGL